MTREQEKAMDGTGAVLDGAGVVSAVTALCGLDRAAATRLERAFRGLVAPGDWNAAAAGCGLPARAVAAPLRDILDMPGDLVLLRSAPDGFRLLHRSERRWHYLGADGTPLDDGVDCDDETPRDAIVADSGSENPSPGGFASLAELWPRFRAAWAEVGMASLFINCGQLVLPLFALLIYDKIALNGLFETLWALVLGMVIYLLTDAGMRLVRSWATERISLEQALQSDERLWAKLMAQVDLPTGGFPRFLSNYRDLTLARDFVSSGYLLAVADIPFLLLYLAVIGVVAWPMMLVTLSLVVVFALAGYLMHTRQKEFSREAERQNTSKLAFMGETLTSLDVVRTSPAAGVFLRTWRQLAGRTSELEARRRLALHRMGMLSSVIQTTTSVVVLTTGVYLIHAQTLSIGKLIACNLLAGRAMALVASLYAVTGKWQDFRRAAAGMESSLEEVTERETTPRPAIDGRLTVIGLGKHFAGRPAALDNVSFEVVPGERIALLGRPGAGKSTLLRCLGGLTRPDTGQILVDGLALDDISRFDRVKWLAYKGQDPVVFAGTLEDNLRISGCTESGRFSAALWASGLENEFQSGRMSLGMTLDERGSNLSGGQRQKVALARALAQPSRILLLDEPTLGLDPESERLLAERLPQLLDAATVLIMTTHSPIMLATVQRVIALDGGRLAADGPREKLVTLSVPSGQRSAQAG